MSKRVYLLLPLLFPLFVAAQGTGDWTLSRAVEYALQNNLQVRRLDNSTELARIALQQSRNNRMPTLNASTGVNLQLGRTIDPTTNTFEARNILSQGYQLQGASRFTTGGSSETPSGKRNWTSRPHAPTLP